MASVDDFAQLLADFFCVACRNRQEDQLAFAKLHQIRGNANRRRELSFPATPERHLVSVPGRGQRDGSTESAGADHSDSKAHR
jgi:hypothetical protein